MNIYQIPRILLCAGASGSGKTLITCGILQALANRGLRVSSFKCGPDYIDPMFHSRVIGTRSGNLDTFFASANPVRYLLGENAAGSDVAVLEGVMGYYDGLSGFSVEASTYDVARTTDTPAILLVNCKGMSLSVCAYIEGFARFQADSRISGVILNRVSPMIYPGLKQEIETRTGLRVIGYVPEVTDCRLESRHLGLVMPDEIAGLREKLMKLAQILEDTLDLDLLLQIGQNAEALTAEIPQQENPDFAFRLPQPVRLAVARDEAFCFFYADNLQLLEKMGAELWWFSPVHGESLPKGADGLLLCGGYPELYAEELAANQALAKEIREKCEGGLPLLAECGGFMYLHTHFADMEDKMHPGVGLLPGSAYRTDKLGRFGYIRLSAEKGGFVVGRMEQDAVFPGQEVHYFDSTDPGDCFLAQKPAGMRSWRCIHSSPTMLVGFPHFYYYGNPALPKIFLQKCLAYHQREGAGS